MRSSTLWSVMLAASLAACGSDGGGDEAPEGDGDGTQEEVDDVAAGDGDDRDGDGEGGGEALCTLAEGGGLSPYDGARVSASCAAGFEAFDTCVATEVNACLTAQQGPCRGEFEAHLCCADEKCELDTDPNAAECVSAQCPDTRQGFLDCGDQGGVEDCIAPAVAQCITEPPTQTPPAGDGATTDEGSIPSELSRTLSIRSQAALRAFSAHMPISGSAE
jgi:hypothetical protein